MTLTFRNKFVGDKPRHDQFSTVKDLSVTQVGWIANSAGVISAAGNINPPQFFATNAGDPQVFTLQCPKGNPDKCWASFTTDEGIVAFVDDYSTVADGFLVVELATAPAGNVRIRGLISFGRNAGENGGAVAAAPEIAKPLISHNQYCVYGLLKQLMLFPVGWSTDGGGDVTETRAPLGTTVEHTGAGEYTIQFDMSFPGLQNRWADLFGNSIGQGASFAYPGGSPQTVVLTLDADMGDGERTGVVFAGPVSKYPVNFNGGGGGVHDDLRSRDIHNYNNFPHGSPFRSSSFIPFRFELEAASVIDPNALGTALPGNMRIVNEGAGEWTVYIGSFPPQAIVGMINASDGVAVGASAVDEDAGTITITRVGGGSPVAGTILQGFLIALTQNVA